MEKTDGFSFNVLTVNFERLKGTTLLILNLD